MHQTIKKKNTFFANINGYFKLNVENKMVIVACVNTLLTHSLLRFNLWSSQGHLAFLEVSCG